MLDDAETVLEEIAPEDRNRNEVLGARVALYAAAKKWDMAAAVGSISYSDRRNRGCREGAEAILLRAQAIHPKVAMIAFNPGLLRERHGRTEEAKEHLRRAIDLDKDVRKLAIDDEDLKPLWNWIGGLK
jgi:tetratricopeptide (TPR) repeat protein